MPYGNDVNGSSGAGAPSDRDGTPSYTRRVLIRAAIYTAIVLILLLVWYTLDMLLLVFAGILLAVFLRGLSDWIAARTPFSSGWALAAVTLGLLGLIGGVGWVLAPTIVQQGRELATQLPEAAGRLRERIEGYTLGQQLVDQVPAPEDVLDEQGGLVEQATGIFSTTLGSLANVLIILVVGLYLAADPTLYRRGVEHLVPKASRRRVHEVLLTLGHTLRAWLVGQFFSMAVVGVLMTVGYWLIGVPLALVLGLIAGILEFIPTFGPILSVVPALVLALLTSPTQALYVLGLYLAVQAIESYVLTPLVQQRAVELPPVVTIIALVALGELLGFLGLLLATPLVAVVMVLIKMLYVEDVLDDHAIEVKGEDEAQHASGAVPH